MNVSPVMPFGKHKGRRLCDLPDDYLAWLTTIDLKDWLRECVEQEIERREVEGGGHEQAGSLVELRAVVERWHRKLSLEFHPDRRHGNTEGMKAINRARDVLMEMMGGK